MPAAENGVFAILAALNEERVLKILSRAEEPVCRKHITITGLYPGATFATFRFDMANRTGTNPMFPMSSGTGKIMVLVVDDEPVIRMGAVCAVEDAGLEVIEAANADEAIQILETRDDIRIIVTDIEMPEGSMNGLLLAAAVRDRWPPIKIIIVSGRYQASKAELPAGSIFISKPYRPEALITQLQQFSASL